MKLTFLEIEEVLEIHHDQLKKYGGAQGIRDVDFLLSVPQEG